MSGMRYPWIAAELVAVLSQIQNIPWFLFIDLLEPQFSHVSRLIPDLPTTNSTMHKKSRHATILTQSFLRITLRSVGHLALWTWFRPTSRKIRRFYPRLLHRLPRIKASLASRNCSRSSPTATNFFFQALCYKAFCEENNANRVEYA